MIKDLSSFYTELKGDADVVGAASCGKQPLNARAVTLFNVIAATASVQFESWVGI